MGIPADRRAWVKDADGPGHPGRDAARRPCSVIGGSIRLWSCSWSLAANVEAATTDHCVGTVMVTLGLSAGREVVILLVFVGLCRPLHVFCLGRLVVDWMHLHAGDILVLPGTVNTDCRQQ